MRSHAAAFAAGLILGLAIPPLGVALALGAGLAVYLLGAKP